MCAKFGASGTGYRTGRPVVGGGRRRRWWASMVHPLPAGDYANGHSAGATAGGAFEVPVEALFLPSSRAVETLGEGGRALQLLGCGFSEEVGVRSPSVPYSAFRRPLPVGQVDGPALLQHLPEYLAGLTLFHDRVVPSAVLPLFGHCECTVLNIAWPRVYSLRPHFQQAGSGVASRTGSCVRRTGSGPAAWR